MTSLFQGEGHLSLQTLGPRDWTVFLTPGLLDSAGCETEMTSDLSCPGSFVQTNLGVPSSNCNSLKVLETPQDVVGQDLVATMEIVTWTWWAKEEREKQAVAS